MGWWPSTWKLTGSPYGRRLFSRHWKRLLVFRERWLPSQEAYHLLLAACVGLMGGICNLLFYIVTESLKLLALRRPGDLVEVAEMFAPWARLAAPALGALGAGLVLQWGLRLVGKEKSTNILEVVAVGDGKLPLRTVLIKAASSLLSISTGASIGREGSITQLSATFGSKWGEWMGWPPYRIRLMLACGAAAGIAAAYNAPITGSVFAAQIILGNFSMNVFAPLMCSAVVAAMLSRTFFGIDPWYQVPTFDFTRVTQLPWFLVLGALSGLLAACVLKALRRTEDLFDKSGLPLYARLTAAGIAVGLLAVWYPEVWGNGYSVTSRILAERYDLTHTGAILGAKVLATLVTVGAGTVGGLMTPTLFLGAALGSVFGHVIQSLGLAQTLPAGVFAVVGMGSMLAATTHSPLLAMIMIFEISLNYSLMPPLMLACAVGTLVARRVEPSSVYTEPLRRRGLSSPFESDQLGAATQLTVGDLMRDPVVPLQDVATLREISDRFLTSPNNFLPVVDSSGKLLGVVALQDLKGYLNATPELQSVIAYDVMRPTPIHLTPNQRLQDALPTLLASELRHIPVVSDASEFRLLGSVARNEALGLLSEAIASRTAMKSKKP